SHSQSKTNSLFHAAGRIAREEGVIDPRVCVTGCIVVLQVGTDVAECLVLEQLVRGSGGLHFDSEAIVAIGYVARNLTARRVYNDSRVQCVGIVGKLSVA